MCPTTTALERDILCEFYMHYVVVSVCLPACLSAFLSVTLSLCLSHYLCPCLSVRLSVCRLVCLSDCLSACLSVSLSPSRSVCLLHCVITPFVRVLSDLSANQMRGRPTAHCARGWGLVIGCTATTQLIRQGVACVCACENAKRLSHQSYASLHSINAMRVFAYATLICFCHAFYSLPSARCPHPYTLRLRHATAAARFCLPRGLR